MNYQTILEKIEKEIQPFLKEGKLANYIPALANVDDTKFAMSIQLFDGTSYNIGDTNLKFSIQSISKVFTFTLALNYYGKELYKRVGHEPSGNPFNSLVQLEYENGIPRNPFINAGAIVTADSLISIYKENTFNTILDFIKNFPDAVQEFASYIVQAGRYIEEKPALAAEIAVEFLDPKKELGLKVPVLKNVLTEPKGIKTNNLYPVKADLDYIQNYMHKEMGIGNIIDLNQFVDMRFADAVCSDKDKSDAVSKASKIDFVEKARQLLERTEKGDIDTHTKAALSLEGKYLRFFLAKETFAIDILRITSIIRLTNITRVPNAQHYIKGVINLRGNIVPVIDLRLKIGLEESAHNDKTRIIIVEDEINKVMIRLGLIVDSVDGVYDIKAEQIESPPDFKKKTESDFIQAVVRDNESVFIILNLLNVMRPPHNN